MSSLMSRCLLRSAGRCPLPLPLPSLAPPVQACGVRLLSDRRILPWKEKPPKLGVAPISPVVPGRVSRPRAGAKKRAGATADDWSVVGYSLAEELDLPGVQRALQHHPLYVKTDFLEDLPDAGCVYSLKKKVDPDEMAKELFIFKEGCAVFWNIPDLERHQMLQFLGTFSVNPYEKCIVLEEAEMMTYKKSNTKNSHLEKGIINIAHDDEDSQQGKKLDKYAFSNAIACSVKLSTWEESLEKVIDSIEFISDDLRRWGEVKVSKEFNLQKTGEVLGLRHVINLTSDLLDTPDFYWDREDLEQLYNITCNHLAVKKRTKVANEKLNHCLEVMQMVSDHLSHEHGATLEKIIIWLIAIEIGFEVLHLYLSYWPDSSPSIPSGTE